MDKNSQQIALLFDEQAANYDAAREATGKMQQANDQLTDVVLEVYLRLQSGGELPEKIEPVCAPLKILDVGTGTGATSLSMRRHFPNASYFGIDISSKMLEQGKLKRAFNIGKIVDISQSLPAIPQKHFDIAVSAFMYEYIRNYERSIANTARALKPGGLYISSHYFFDEDEPLIHACVNENGNVVLPVGMAATPYHQFYPTRSQLLAAFDKHKLNFLPQPILKRTMQEMLANPFDVTRQLFYLQKEL